MWEQKYRKYKSTYLNLKVGAQSISRDRHYFNKVKRVELRNRKNHLNTLFKKIDKLSNEEKKNPDTLSLVDETIRLLKIYYFKKPPPLKTSDQERLDALYILREEIFNILLQEINKTKNEIDLCDEHIKKLIDKDPFNQRKIWQSVKNSSVKKLETLDNIINKNINQELEWEKMEENEVKKAMYEVDNLISR